MNILTLLAEYHEANNTKMDTQYYIELIRELKEDGLDNNEILTHIAELLG